MARLIDRVVAAGIAAGLALVASASIALMLLSQGLAPSQDVTAAVVIWLLLLWAAGPLLFGRRRT